LAENGKEIRQNYDCVYVIGHASAALLYTHTLQLVGCARVLANAALRGLQLHLLGGALHPQCIGLILRGLEHS
jgi:hypothetical protein